MTRVLTVGTGLGILLVCAVVNGRWTNRWGEESRAVEDGVARLAAVPRTVGDWQAADEELSAAERQGAGGAGYLLRRYTNVRNVFVAGDASHDAQFVVVAAAEGVKAAVAINQALQQREIVP